MNSIGTSSSTSEYFISSKQLRKSQAVAGMLFLIFLILHICNTLLASFGVNTYDNYQHTLQKIYQYPIIEFVFILLPLLSHAIVGIMLFIRKRKSQKKTQNIFSSLHTLAGLFLLLVVFGHIAATRGIAFYADTFVGFSGVAFSIKWMPFYFYPYYFLLFMAGLYHGFNGLSLVLIRMGYMNATNKKGIQKSVLFFGTIGITLALLSFGGIFFEIPNVIDNDYARAYSKIIGIDLDEIK